MGKTERKLVAIYVRKSRLKDTCELEITRQLELLTDYAEANDMDYEVFAEEGSSEEGNRPEYQRMLMEIKINIYDGILCTDQDRITRDRTDFALFVRFMKAEGLTLYTLNRTYNFMNEEDILKLDFQSEMDDHFMKMTKNKLMRGRIQAVRKGVYFGLAPYGYAKDDTKHLIPHPEESEVVEDIFNMYVKEGLNQAELVEQLNMRGKLTRAGKPFTVRATSLILSNVAYKGTVHYELTGEDVITVEEAHPSLVDADTFNKAQLIRAGKRVVPQHTQRGVYSLSRLLVCPKCNQTLSFCMKYNKRSGRKTLDKSQRELYILNCHASKGGKAKADHKASGEPRCSNNGIKSARVEQEILNKLKNRLTDIDKEVNAILSGNKDIISKVTKKQQELTLQYNKLEEQKKKVQDGYKMGIYEADEALTEIKSIKEQQLVVNHELKALDGADAKSELDKQKKAKQKIERLLSMDINADPVKTNKLLHEVIDKVFYWKERSDVGGEKPFEVEMVFKGEL